MERNSLVFIGSPAALRLVRTSAVMRLERRFGLWPHHSSLAGAKGTQWLGGLSQSMPSYLPDGASYCTSGNMGKAAGLTEDELSRSLI